jgi:uncharacterized protein YdbL (DUF1318 family)
MKQLKWLSSSFMGLMLVSCVTINIYFPAAAAEEAADRIIEDVWGTETQADEPEQQSLLNNAGQLNLAVTLLNWVVSPAQAAGPDLNINSPAISTLQAKMKKRFTSLKPYYSNGAIGLTEDGLVTIRDNKSIPLKNRNLVKALVENENNDRSELYSEIARVNGHLEWRVDIQSTFARRWVSNASPGWWYQSGGSWKQK